MMLSLNSRMCNKKFYQVHLAYQIFREYLCGKPLCILTCCNQWFLLLLHLHSTSSCPCPVFPVRRMSFLQLCLQLSFRSVQVFSQLFKSCHFSMFVIHFSLHVILKDPRVVHDHFLMTYCVVVFLWRPIIVAVQYFNLSFYKLPCFIFLTVSVTNVWGFCIMFSINIMHNFV